MKIEKGDGYLILGWVLGVVLLFVLIEVLHGA